MFEFPNHQKVNPYAAKPKVISAYEVISRSKTVIKSFDTYQEAKEYCETHRNSYSIRYRVEQ